MGTVLNLQRNGYGDAVTIWLICDGILCTDIFLLSFISFFTEKSLITEHTGYSILDIKQNSGMENCRIKSSISDHTLWENCAVRIASGRTGRQFDAAADWHTSQRLSLVTLMCIKLKFLSHNQDCAGFPWILYLFFPHPILCRQRNYATDWVSIRFWNLSNVHCSEHRWLFFGGKAVSAPELLDALLKNVVLETHEELYGISVLT